LQNSLSYIAVVMIVVRHGRSNIIIQKPPIFNGSGPASFLSFNTVKFVKFGAA
jgi:hypothetical protein